jgi:hypothetical protein
MILFLVFTIPPEADPTLSDNYEPKTMNRIHGAVAQLGEHYLRKVGVGGSNPLCSSDLSRFWRDKSLVRSSWFMVRKK